MPSRRELANAIRALSMDAVQQANSGHPGAPMGMADIAEVLWNDFLTHNPGNPSWVDRDRFVLSNGHASMLLYSLLHLSGYDLPMDQLRNFRQLHSATPGHPEFGHTPGVETTTGPLGQGLANAVGMAIAERRLAAEFNRPGHAIVDHRTFAFCGDGCLMEGISHEVCSLAGTLGLGKLVVVYDDNGISIDGEVEAWFSDDTAARFRAYGWQVIESVDGHDPAAIREALQAALDDTARPSLVCCRTVIGRGAPNKAGSESVHGAPLGAEEVAATRAAIGWQHQPFEIPEDIRSAWDAHERGGRAESAWNERYAAYRAAHPELAAEFDRRMAGELPRDFVDAAPRHLAEVDAQAAKVATRKASQVSLDALAPLFPELLGGSADLTGSNNTWWQGSRAIGADDPGGNYLFYGVREFGMAGIMNGLSLHGGIRPYGGTFLIFMEYMRNAVRMAALMAQPAIFVFTHDSIGLGEDGPTHQPVEQLTALRATPGLETWRPCDAVETAAAWIEALQRRDGPTALVLSRQGLAHQARDPRALEQIARGAYVLEDCDGEPELLLLATGSEVDPAREATRQLAAQGHRVRLVSMPSCERFAAQDAAYRDAVLPPAVRRRVAVEAGHRDFWYRFVGLDGDIVGMSDFGASAPGPALMAHFGFTVERIVAAAQRQLGR
jgi:transketolase